MHIPSSEPVDIKSSCDRSTDSDEFYLTGHIPDGVEECEKILTDDQRVECELLPRKMTMQNARYPI